MDHRLAAGLRVLDSVDGQVVNDAVDTDRDQFRIPDKIDYKGPGSHHYPLSEEDITDSRESEAVGSAATFKLADLIFEIFEENAVLKAKYIVEEGGQDTLNWNQFLTDAMQQEQAKDDNGHPMYDESGNPVMETVGFTIPYHKYF